MYFGFLGNQDLRNLFSQVLTQAGHELLANQIVVVLAAPPAKLMFRDVEMEEQSRQVRRGGKIIELRQKEFEILRCLMQSPEQVISRKRLAQIVWNMPRRTASLDNHIDVHISRLRKALDGPFRTKLLHTVRGRGFILRSAKP